MSEHIDGRGMDINFDRHIRHTSGSSQDEGSYKQREDERILGKNNVSNVIVI